MKKVKAKLGFENYVNKMKNAINDENVSANLRSAIQKEIKKMLLNVTQLIVISNKKINLTYT